MFVLLLPYLLLLVLAGSAAVLLTSKRVAERFVGAGILPRTFLGVIPALQLVIRIFGAVLVGVGVLKIAVDAGWLDGETLSRYAFPVCLIFLGGLMLLLNRRT